MKSPYEINRRKNLFIFSSIFLVASCIAGFLISFVGNNDQTGKRGNEAILKAPVVLKNDPIETGFSVLLARVNELNSFDKQYAHLLLVSGDREQLDSVNRIIEAKERSLRITFDSINFRLAPQPDNAFKITANHSLSLYQAIIENRKTCSDLRKNIFIIKNTPEPDTAAMIPDLSLQEQEH